MNAYENSLPDKGIILRMARRATDFLEEHVLPVFRLDEHDRLSLEGTGLLARLNDRFYLVTAAHVIDACKFGVFVPQKDGHIEPLGADPTVTANKPGTTRTDDRFDVGFVRLSDEETASFGPARFLDLDHVYGPSMPLDSTLFIVLGYPARNQIDNTVDHSVETPITMFLTGVADQRAHRLALVDDRSHILLRDDPRATMTRKSKGSPPDMHGISGGGVWPMSVFDEPSRERPPLLAGIVVEKPIGFHSSLLVTRGEVLNYFIKKFDDTAAAT